MGAHSRNKGNRWERCVAHDLQAACPGDDIKRAFQFRGGGEEQPDVTSELFYIECKHQKTVSVVATMKQALRDREAQGLIAKYIICPIKEGTVTDRKDPIIVMLRNEWVDLDERMANAAKRVGSEMWPLRLKYKGTFQKAFKSLRSTLDSRLQGAYWPIILQKSFDDLDLVAIDYQEFIRLVTDYWPAYCEPKS